MVSKLAFLLLPALCAGLQSPLLVQQPAESLDVKLVPVVLGVMSRCPDALLCESVFDRVVKPVADKIDLTLSYVAKFNASEPDFGITCMHGPEECAGNVHQLCVAKYTPLTQWWGFVQCNNYQGRNKIGRPETALSCAKSSNIDWEGSGVGECAGLDGSGKGEEGIMLLHESAKASQQMNIEKSCTVIINGNKVCIRDDGSWKECEAGHDPSDFIRQINQEYQRLNANTAEDE